MGIKIEEGMNFLKNGAVYRTTMVSERDGRTTIQIVNNNDIDDVFRVSTFGHPTVDTVETKLGMSYIDSDKISVSLEEAEEHTIKADPNPPSMAITIEPIFITGSKSFSLDMIAVRNKFISEGKVVLMKPFDVTLQQEDNISNVCNAIHDMIRISHKVFVVNKNGYISESTRSDIEYAESLNKEIEYLEESNQQSPEEYIKKKRDDTIEQLDQKYKYLMEVLKSLIPKIGIPMIDESLSMLPKSVLRKKAFEIPAMNILKINHEPKLEIYTPDLSINIWVECTEGKCQIRVNMIYYRQATDRYDLDKCCKLYISVCNKETPEVYSIDYESEIPDVTPNEVCATKLFSDAIKDFFKDKIKEEN